MLQYLVEVIKAHQQYVDIGIDYKQDLEFGSILLGELIICSSLFISTIWLESGLIRVLTNRIALIRRTNHAEMVLQGRCYDRLITLRHYLLLMTDLMISLFLALM